MTRRSSDTAYSRRVESYRDLAAYLRRVGFIHMHWVRKGARYGWSLIHRAKTPVCDTDRCVRIPLQISG